MGKKLTTEEFIERAREVHGDRYDYSQTVYRKSKETVDIICPIHGLFQQTAISHLCGHGCYKCGTISGHNLQRGSTEIFIAKAYEVHGGKYDYSKVNYVDSNTKVDIICKKHGIFRQTPSDHIGGHGCHACSVEQSAKEKTNTIEQFISSAQMIHGGRYDYSKVEYTHSKSKVCIICPEHGEFWQTPNNHLKGHGCPKCRAEKIKSLLYGVGVNDCIDAKSSVAYKYWNGMLRRCYSAKKHKKWPSYEGCSVCTEWHYFSNFKKWFDENYVDGYALDKDIIAKGNRIYSPETCCFVPARINNIILNRKIDRGEYPIGVTKKWSKYYAHVSIGSKSIRIGAFASVKEAFDAYKDEKERYIRQVATEYFGRGEITKRVYDAMMRYQIEITD